MPDSKDDLDSPKSGDSPLVFISHDSRDAELAEAFSKLLKSISAGMLKSFRSSDKKGNEGIEFGDEWYKALMSKLISASDVVCLLTERSLERPWILYEAGVAKGKLDTPVHGLALGVALSRVSTGPFYQFQNSDDSEDSLSKLVHQLCKRVPNLEPDRDVVTSQVVAFKASIAEALKGLSSNKKNEKQGVIDEGSMAKILEEMKLIVRELPMRLDLRVVEAAERFRSRRPTSRRPHLEVLDQMTHMIAKDSSDPVGVLIISSLFREDFPWLYEIGLEAYRAATGGSAVRRREALKLFREAADITLRGPLTEELGGLSKEERMTMSEIPSLIDHYMRRILSRPVKKREVFTRSAARRDGEHSE